MKRQRLTAIVGSGGSIDLGVPSAAQLTEAVLQALEESSSKEERALSAILGHLTPFAALRDALKRYFDTRFDFEHLLDAIEAATSLKHSWWPSVAPHMRVVEALLCGGPRGELVEVFDYGLLQKWRNILLETVHDGIAKACARVRERSQWNAYRKFWTRLRDEFDLTVMTTNYDTCIEDALELSERHEGFEPAAGTRPARFVPKTFHGYPKLLHLHGSIRFGWNSRRFGELERRERLDSIGDLCYYRKPEDARATWHHGVASTSQGGREMAIAPLVTGGLKTEKLLIEPSLTYSHLAAASVLETNRLLVVGYGARDAHINALLSHAVSWHGGNRRVAFITQIPEDTWRPSADATRPIWAGDRPDEYRLLSALFDWDDPARTGTDSNPWISRSGCVSGYLDGLVNTIETREDDLHRFLAPVAGA